MNTVENENFEEIVLADGAVNVAAFLPCVRSHGPGRRVSLWVQGCLKRCAGCINPTMLAAESTESTVMPPKELLRKIHQARDSVSEVRGITLHGGEPTLQARNLAPLLEVIRGETPEMNVLMFTGYPIEFLRALKNDAVNRLLANVDTVIDGPYENANRDSKRVAGSTNQRIHHLTDKLVGSDFTRHGVETVSLLSSGELVQTGANVN
jgi:anaerobic ribonucleoside-triphosphate reductase activating protein